MITNNRKFRVGEPVRVTNYDDGLITEGDEGIVAKVGTHGAWPYEVEFEGHTMLWLFSADEIEKVEG